MLVFPVVAVAGEVFGPPAGNVRYQGNIQRDPFGDGQADVDDFPVALAAGDVLSAKVVSPFNSGLFPTLVVVDPDGEVRDAGVADRGKRSSFKGFEADESGVWRIRVEANIASEGLYTVTFKVKSPGRIRLAKEAVGGGLATTRTVSFQAVHGSELTAGVKWGRTDSPVRFVSLKGPSGAEVLAEQAPAVGGATVKGRKASLAGAVLNDGHGEYSLTVGVDSGAATFTLDLSVSVPARPKSRRLRRLGKLEPFLDPADAARRGIAGFPLRLTGHGFDLDLGPQVYFGDTPAADVTVNETGTVLDVLPPEGVDDTTVDVTVVNADGQAACRPGHFYYVPPPTLTGITDRDGGRVDGATTAGGPLVRLAGAQFQSGLLVRMGTAPSIVPLILSPELLEFAVPPHPVGVVDVLVFDTFGHEAVLEGVFEFKGPPTFDPVPYSPPTVPDTGTATVIVRGSGFRLDDRVFFDGVEVPSLYGSSSVFSFVPLPRPDGSYRVSVVDRVGSEVAAPDIRVQEQPEITSVTAVAGPFLGTRQVSLHGGAVVQIAGAHFAPTDTVTIGGAAATLGDAGATTLTVTVPAGAAGDADVVVTDLSGRTVTASAALRYVGFSDSTSSRSPGASDADDLGAVAGAVGDLDGDGGEDDLVLSSFDTAIGTRTVYTRILVEDTGALVDTTSTSFPAAETDDDWNASAVAVGDLDGGSDSEIVIAGVPDAYDQGTGTVDYTLPEVRFFSNDGSGAFTRSAGDEPPSTYAAEVRAQDENGRSHLVFGIRYPQGAPTSIVLGDLDGDDDLDVIVGRDSYEYRYVDVDPGYVDFTQTPPYVNSSDAANQRLLEYRYDSATRVFENDFANGNGLVDRTGAWMPSAGTSADATPLPAFHARAVALGDIDGDDDLDLVVTWDDPTTVTAYGLYQGTGSDSPRIATRILTNDGNGAFTDATASMFPTPVSPEFFQAHSVALADLDGDDDLDLVLLHAQGVDAFAGNPQLARHALRILENQGNQSPRFRDVTSLVLPTVPLLGRDAYQGRALRVADLDGDGHLDILVGTDAAIVSFTLQRMPSTRLLLGSSGFAFRDVSGFLPPADDFSGETRELLLGDLDGTGAGSLLLLDVAAPVNGPGSEKLRILDWNR